MNESQKTGIFAAVAAVVLLLAFLTRPVAVTKEDETGTIKAGDLLFKEDTADLSKAASLKITKFDEDKLSMETFEIARDKQTQLWRIPSEYNYPADADEQLKNATSPLAGLKILRIDRDAGPGDQSEYGVVEPSDKLEAGVTGVGILVSIADATGSNLASLIIGKPEKDNDQLRYVRIPNQDPIYTVEIDTTAFNTDFKKWIKPELLNIKGFDITGIGIRDYQTEQRQGDQGGIQVALRRAMEADASYDTTKSKWNLDRLVEFEGANAKPVELAETEELKGDKLNALRNAAQSLQIVGVRPKPKGLAADLKADKALLENEESMLSLLEQGFIPYPNGDTTEILANAGETLLTTKDGVRYTLRFGEEVITSAALQAGVEDKDKDKDSPTSKRERYLLVTASLDESKFPPPDLQAVPDTIEDLKKMDAEKAAAQEAAKAAIEQANNPAPPTPPAEPKAEDKPAEPKADKPEEPKTEEPKGEAKPDDSKPEENKPEENKPQEPKPEENKAEEPKAETCADPSQEPQEPKQDQPKQDEPKAEGDKPAEVKPVEAKPADDKPAEAKPAEAKPAEAKPADAKPADAKPADEKKAPPTDEELKDRLTVVQAEITKSNQRLLDTRNERIANARKQAQELNARFADWYYLIDDASFKQLMLKRDVLIGPKAAPGEAGAPPAAPGFGGLPPNLNFGNPQ